MNILLIVAVLLGVVLLYAWSVYNALVTLKGRIKASIQEIGNQLKRQAELIPNLIESVKGYMKHEQAALDKITDARKSVLSALDNGTAKGLMQASDQLTQALGALRVVVESTPQLQAAGPTQDLMSELRDTADKVMYSRRTLIDLTADYNIRIATFPTSILAKFFNFNAEEGLNMPGDESYRTVTESDTKTPKVNLS